MSTDSSELKPAAPLRLPTMNLFKRILLSFAAAILFQGLAAAIFMVGLIERAQSEFALKELQSEAHAVFEGLCAWKLELWKAVNELEADASLAKAVAASPYTPENDTAVLQSLRESLTGLGHDFAALRSAHASGFRLLNLGPRATSAAFDIAPLYERGHPYIDALEFDGAFHFMGAARIANPGGPELDVFLFKRIDEVLVSALSFNAKTGIVLSAGTDRSVASHRAQGLAEAAARTLLDSRVGASAYLLEDDWQIGRVAFGLAARRFGTVLVAGERRNLWVSTLLSRVGYRDEIGRFNLLLLLVLVGLALITILVSVAITRSVSLPVRRLCQGMRSIESGSFDAILEGSSIAEMDELLRGFNAMAERLGRDKAEIELSISRMVQAEKMASVGMLSAGLAHEVNNPLNSILSNVQNLLAEEPDAGKHEVLALVESETKRIARIVRALLDFSSPRRGAEARPVCSPVPVVKELISLVRYSLRNSRGITLEMEAGEADFEIAMSADELKQVMLNLFRNSLSAIGQEGSVLVRIGPGGARGEDQEGGGALQRAIVEVEDSGAGIGADILPRIFDPFFSTRSGGEGLGLGLSVVYGIVTEREGSISARSEPGKGTTIRMELPLAEATAPEGGRDGRTIA